MLSESAKIVLDKHIELFEKSYTEKFKKDIKDREQRRKIFYKEFQSSESINKLDIETFKDKIFKLWAFSGWGNKQWFFENTMKINDQTFSHVKLLLTKLCFENDLIENRINTFLDSMEGMSFAFFTEILYITSDSKFPIYNVKAKTVLNQLNINIKDSLPRGSKRDNGLIYREFIVVYKEILKYISSKNNLIDNFEKLDTLFWLVNYSEDAEPIFDNDARVADTDEMRIFVVKMGSKQDFSKLLQFWKQNSIASFGITPDLNNYDPKKNIHYNYEYLKSVMKTNGSPEGRIKKISGYVSAFHSARPKRDWVIAYFKSNLYGFGSVKSGYHLNNGLGQEWNQAIEVEWNWLENPINLPTFSKSLYKHSKHNSSVNLINDTLAISDFKKIIKEYGSRKALTEVEDEIEDQVGSMTIDQLSADTFISVERLIDIESSLVNHKKNQIIFDGVPGTGKTFVAEKFANYLKQKEGKSVGAVQLISCHGGITFEYLFQGLTPRENGGLSSEKGLITTFAETAQENPDANYILILDEINRANIPQVFGQMLYLLEYREKSIDLPFSSETISFPKNLLIIATMNSEDRSAGVLDFAFRRRFSHYRFDPDNKVLKSWLNKKYKNSSNVNTEKVINLFNLLNTKLKQHDDNFQIGHSYFMTEYSLSDEGLNRLWETEIMPLLEERFFHSKNIVKSEFTLNKLIDEKNLIKEKLAG